MSLTQALCTPLSVLLALSTFADGRFEAVWRSGAYLSQARYGHELGVPPLALACSPIFHEFTRPQGA